jgi:two-component system, LytTR family, sensor kinase
MEARLAAASPSHRVAAIRAVDTGEGRDTHGSVVAVWIRRLVLLSAIWSIPGLIVALSTYAAIASKDPASITFGKALLWRFPEWQVWALATPLVIALGRRFPITRPWPALPIHLVANAAIATAVVLVYCLCSRLVGEEYFLTASLSSLVPLMLVKMGFLQMLVYWLVIVADQALSYQRRLRASVAQQVRLEAQLVEAQLDALKMQLHPHFLFNTINAITVLMRKGEGASAVKMLNGLADLLRRSLSRLRVELVPLREELDFIERYLDIETTRFPDRLRVSLDIPAEVREAKVPNLILQPIVENAIKHGIAPRIRGGAIEIAACVRGDRLAIEVRDDGVGLAAGRAADSAGHGVGLSHVRKRLEQLYPGEHRFALEPRQPAGVVATLEIPLAREAP